MSEPKAPNIVRIVERWAYLLGALFVVGPLASRVTAGLVAPDGSQHTSLLVTSGVPSGLLAMLAVFALTLVVALVCAVRFGPRRAMLASSFCLAWASWTTGTIDEIIRSLRGGSPVTMLVVEAALVGVLLLLLVLVAMRFGRVQEVGPDGIDIVGGRGSVGANLRGMASLGGLAGLAVAVAVGGLVAWIFALSPLKGQAVFAAWLAAIGAGAGSHLASIAVADEDHPAPVLAPFAALVLLAIASPIAMSAMAGDGLWAAARAGDLFPLGHILPLDWAAGALLGVPLGLAWARSMVEDKGASAGRSRAKASA